MPSPGKITSLHLPSGMGVRVDTHIFAGYEIPPYYDSMICKLIVHDTNRINAINKMKGALSEIVIEGVKTIIPYHLYILNNDKFISLDEINKSLQLIFQLIDENIDGKISKEEIIELKNIIETLS